MSSLPSEVDAGRTDAGESDGVITVAYWAAARAAAGVATETFAVAGPTSLDEVVRRVLDAHPGEQMARVIGVCSALVGDRPSGNHPPQDVVVAPGERVDFLPPFAGG